MIKHGDCLELMKEIPDGSVDLTVTSPPYDNQRLFKGHINSFKFEPTAQELWRVTKPGGVIVWIVNDATINGSETGTSFKQALRFKEIGFNLHDTMIWEKCGYHFSETNRYYPIFEYMFVLSKGKPKTANLLRDRENISYGKKIHGCFRRPNGNLYRMKGHERGDTIPQYGVRWNVWKVREEGGQKTGHPAVYPLKLVEDHMRTWCNEGDTVLDPFMGSGTTGVACLNLNRKFIGFEIDEEYFEIAQRRIDEALAKKRRLVQINWL